MTLNLRALSAFHGFGMERSLLQRPSCEPVPYPLPPRIVEQWTTGGTLVLGDAEPGGGGCQRVSRRDQSGILVKLGSWSGVAQAALDELWKPGSGLVADAEFLADLADPRPLLLAIKRRCRRSGEQVLFSAPLRGVPQWCWSADEFEQLLRLCGFQLVVEQSDTRRLWSASSDAASQAALLQELGFDPVLAAATQLLLTSEDATVVPTGGIGTYTKMRKALSLKLPVLYCNFDVRKRAVDGRTFWPEDLIGPISRESFVEGFGIVEAVRVLLMVMPELQTVEFQDYQSLGFRLVQSKATGGLPGDLQLKVFLHGSVDYIKHGVQDDAAALYSFDEASTAARDAYVFANADEAISPSRYLADLLRDEFGHEFRNLSVRPLPFDMDRLPTEATVHFGPIRIIAFIGKYNSLKGWPDFVAALKSLEQADLLSGIEHIVALAPGAPPGADAAAMRTIAPFRPLHLPHAELLDFVATRSTDTLFLIPSRGENYPFVVLEQVLIGSRFVAYDSGGAPEVIGDRDYVGRFCAEPNPSALAAKIAEILAIDPNEHQEYVASLRYEVCHRQRDVNISWSREPDTATPAAPATSFVPNVSIVIPVYNTRATYVSDLVHSIQGSVLRPSEVILVDDGSDPDYASRLIRQVRDSGLPARVVRQQNQGLASARNLGLAESRSEFTYFIDSDDILLPGALGDSWMAMMNDPGLIAVGGFGLYFTDVGRLPRAPELQREGRFWKPLGIPEARAVSLCQNQFMAANAMVRTNALLEFGGWDDADRSMWEDWALFSRLAWSGKRFCLLPQPTFLYRNTPGSMSKTHSRYFARRRLARNLPMLNRLDATTVLSLATMNGGAGSSVLPLTSYEAAAITFVRKMLILPGVRRLAMGSYRKLQAARRGWATLRNTLRLR